jgi:NAD(P)-dependent dehydrogenase (short-subunit alcohol dehydrogenase family)
MSGICDGRVAIVTGGGRGIGRAHALALASEGARVVVNDLDVAVDGSKSQGSSAAEVVEQIRDAGGHATVNTDDVASWPGAERLVRSAIDSFGRLDSLVCNAGNLLDRPLVDMSEHDWGTVVSVHLNGHAAPLHHAARHWRSIAERTGEPSGGRAVLTTSGAGLWGDPWRTNYSSAKAGIAMLGRTAAAELTAYGVSVNVIAPFARTRMTVQLDPGLEQLPPPGEFDPFDAANISPLVVWLSADHAVDVTGEIFEVHGGHIGLVTPPRRGSQVGAERSWEPSELGAVVERLFARTSESGQA